MNKSNQRGKKIFANRLHKDIFLLVFLASAVPALITAIVLFYLIFNGIAEQIGIPEAIGYTIVPAAQKVIAILLMATPICIVTLLVFAHRTAHQMVGPFDRIIRELDESIAGKRQGPIRLRKDDKFKPLVDRINILLDKFPR